MMTAWRSLLRAGPAIYALAIVGLGIETLVYATSATLALGPAHTVIPVIPWLPANRWLGYGFGIVLVAGGLCVVIPRFTRAAALLVGGLFAVCTVALEIPKNAADIASISLRTAVFEVLAIACSAYLLPKVADDMPRVAVISRYLLAISLIAFGVDHFLALGFIATLVPGWIPLHAFFVGFFGVAFIVAAISIATGFLVGWSAALLGLMFASWVLTLHLPRVLGLYAIPGAPHDPSEWSSLLIAVALWGGAWGVASRVTPREQLNRRAVTSRYMPEERR